MAQPPPSSEFSRFSTGLYAQEKTPLFQWTKKTTIVVLTVLLVSVFWWYRAALESSEKAEQLFAISKDYSAKQSYELAVQKIDEAIELKPTAGYYYEKFQLLIVQELYYQAEQSITEAVELEPNNANYWYELGKYYAKSGGTLALKALETFKKSVDLEPNNSDFAMAYASALMDNHQEARAITVLERVLKQDPYYYLVYNQLSVLYDKTEQSKKSLAIREASVKQFPDSAYYWYWLANAYERYHNKPKAVASYQKCMVLDPERGANAAYRVAALTGQKVKEYYRELVEDTIPAVKDGNAHWLVSASVEGENGRFLLDTGASDSVLFKHFMMAHHLTTDEETGKATAPVMQYQTAKGVISAPVYYADMKIGRFSLTKTRVAVLPSPQKEDNRLDGIIGMDALKNFNVRIDNLKNRLILSTK